MLMNACVELEPREALPTLTGNALPQLRGLVVALTVEELVITGTVSSFYLKQLAQEAVRPFLGTRRLINRVQVS
jgi:hypothetical protein